MSSAGRRGGSRGRDDDEKDRDDHEPERHREHESDEEYDDPAEHLEIERQRFAGGLQPTPELYALAREQWYQLPGGLSRPSMDPVIGAPASGDTQPPGQSHPDDRETRQ